MNPLLITNLFSDQCGTDFFVAVHAGTPYVFSRVPPDPEKQNNLRLECDISEKYNDFIRMEEIYMLTVSITPNLL